MGTSADTRRLLLYALDLRRIIDDLDRGDLVRARERAAEVQQRVLSEAAGVPLVVASACLGLSVPSVRRLRDVGVIARHSPEGPKLELGSLVDAWVRLQALRADGRRRGLVERLAQEAADREP